MVAVRDAALLGQLRALGCDLVAEPLTASTPTVISCPDPDEEVRQVARHCARLLDSGTPADDIAMVCAVENFEDHPEYGERQITELG